MRSLLTSVIVLFSIILIVKAFTIKDAHAIDIVPLHNAFQVVSSSGKCYDMVKFNTGEILVLSQGICY
jgi:hypothetical protein